MHLIELIKFIFICEEVGIKTFGDLKKLNAKNNSELWEKVYDKKNKITAR